jgi:hypothetical protein
MTDDEYRQFLSFLFERYVRPRIPRLRREFHHHMMDEWNYHLSEAERAAQIMRYIEMYCDNDEDVYRTFTLGRLRSAVSDTRFSLEFSNRVAEEAGYLEAMEPHARDVLEGLEARHMPDADKEVLREMGSPNPEAELSALVLLAKASRGRFEWGSNEVSIGHQLRYAVDRLEKARQDLKEDEKSGKESVATKPRKSRRWFTGLGKIAQGTALSIANIALAVGALHFPVSPETKTWGSVASVATGIGTIFAGIGDLRNE